MVRKTTAFLSVLMLAGIVTAISSSDAYGAKWYPFYGYHRPSYLSERATATVQSTARPSATVRYCPTSQTEATLSQPATSQSRNSSHWYRFYGNRRPSYMDE